MTTFLSRAVSGGLLGAILVAGIVLAAGAPASAAQASLHLADPHALGAVAFGGLVVNAANLRTLYQGFKTLFNQGLGQAPSQYEQIALTVPSSTREEQYGWLGKMAGFREWVGDRVINNITAHGYAITNKDYENTIAVPRNDIEDDQYGVYSPVFQEMGEVTLAHPNLLTFGLLKQGFTGTCYDGQYFFDTDHPVIGEDGSVGSVANTDGGAGTPWFLMDLSRTLKPIIFQKRKDYTFVAMDAPTDEAVFSRKEFRYGVDARVNVGFGLWQLAWGSKQTLDATHYATARAALSGMKGDHGRPLGIRPTHLVVPPALEGKALEIVNAERDTSGATNVWKGTAQVVVVPWLA